MGSAPDALRARHWDKRNFDHIVAINNAWQIREDWDYLIFPEDFPQDKHPKTHLSHQALVTATQYVPIQNQYGGFVYAGGTMAFTAAYWALGHLKPSALLFIGCDMVYPSPAQIALGEASHFYGSGTADPLRQDHSLQSLEAKSARFLYFAQQEGCAVFNLSVLNASRLLFPRMPFSNQDQSSLHALAEKSLRETRFNHQVVKEALALESHLNYYFDSGRYWEHTALISASACRAVDALWLSSMQST
jgi:hypothetical protein